MTSGSAGSWLGRLIGTEPAPVPPHVFAVGPERLRYARFYPTPDALEFREYLAEDLEPGMFPEGPMAGAPRDPERLGESVDAVLESASTKVKEASLVLPDSWLRLAFADAADVPRAGAQRDEVIRFKLKRLVPFRVEDLRVAAASVPRLGGDSAFSEGGAEASSEERSEERLLLGFAAEALVGQLEAVFAARGIRIGHVANESLSLLAALGPTLGGLDTGLLVFATEASYSLIVARHGEPVLHRFKSVGRAETGEAGSVGGDWEPALVARDLRLTRHFVATQMAGAAPSEVFVVSPRADEAEWIRAVEECFELPARSLHRDWGELVGTVTGVPLEESAALLGAASRRVR